MLGRKIRPKASKAKQGLRHFWKKLPTSSTKSEGKAPTTALSGSEETAENEVPAVSVRPATAATAATAISQKPAGLRITVTARFELPVDFTNSHTYQTSPEFEGSDKIFNALVNRIQHCANELITRHDPDAAQPLLGSPPHVKDARYHLIFQVERDGQPWGQQYFACFQKQPIDAAAARKVIYGTDRIVSLFLQRHDPGFHWELPAIVSEEQTPHKTYHPVIGCAQALDCIPNYSGMPGYTIELSLKTQHRGNVRNWVKTIESRQNSPLTLHSGESLMARVQDTIQRAFEGRETAYDEAHFGCNGLEGTGGCQHYEEDAFGLEVKLRNNIGPEFSHFHFKIQTFQLLFTQDQTAEFDEFVELIEGNVEDLRDEADTGIGSLDDLRVQVQFLSCKDWSMERALAVSLDCSITECRTTIEAVLERIQAGLNKTLQSQGFSAAITAHKRGHLVLDTFIQGIPDIEPETTAVKSETATVQSTNQTQTEAENRLAILKLLREGISQDITAVCKDTCSLGEVAFMVNLKITPACDEDTLSKYSNTPPVSICLSQRKIVKRAAQENLRLDSPDGSATRENEEEEQLDETQDYDCTASSKGGASLTSAPSLADIDSARQTDGITTPASARKPSPADQWGLMPEVARGRTLSKSTRLSSGSYIEEPSVIHHPAHLGDATLRLIENLDQGEMEIPSTVEISSTKEIPSMAEIPSIEEVPSIEELPSIVEIPSAVDIPSTKEASSTKEVPSTEEVPSTREVSSTEVVPSTEEVPSTKEVPSTEEVPSTNEVPSTEEICSTEKASSTADIPSIVGILSTDKIPQEASSTSDDSTTKALIPEEGKLEIVQHEDIYERPKSPEEIAREATSTPDGSDTKTLIPEENRLEIVLQEDIYERPNSPKESLREAGSTSDNSATKTSIFEEQKLEIVPEEDVHERPNSPKETPEEITVQKSAEKQQLDLPVRETQESQTEVSDDPATKTLIPEEQKLDGASLRSIESEDEAETGIPSRDEISREARSVTDDFATKTLILEEQKLDGASLRLIESEDESCTDVPSAVDVPPRDEISREVRVKTDDFATETLIPEAQNLKIESEEDIYERPQSREEIEVQKSVEKQQLDTPVPETQETQKEVSDDSATKTLVPEEQKLEIVQPENTYERPKSPEETAVQESAEKQQPDTPVPETLPETQEVQRAVSITPDKSDGAYTTDAPQVTTTTITPVVPRKSSRRHGDFGTKRQSFRLSQNFGQLRIFSLSGTVGGLPPATTKIHAEGHIPRGEVSSIPRSDASSTLAPSVSE
ncbi:unnamed protein product [Clonostachys byssicola]|uniref:Pt repeat family protein n=1 Tax=Clonostachys byssicola TaxID=160290 RepID=A0A9N9TWT6_9HYPO|nr:unnamed protein product [Clonostachys byssicola]